MRCTPLLLIATLALPVTAQTQLVRGDVDSIRGTNRFQLDCTQIPLVSSTVNLAALEQASSQQDIEYEMQVTNVGTAANPTLDVVSAVQIPEMFDMGNLRFGRVETWEVFGTPGTTAVVAITARALTSYAPIGPAGAWLLGGNFLTLREGTINAIGRFQFGFQVPSNTELLGTEFTAQAAIIDVAQRTLTLTNPDCKTVEN